jgi:hypothetical protein
MMEPKLDDMTAIYGPVDAAARRSPESRPGADNPREAGTLTLEARGMTHSTLGRLLERLLTDLEGSEGFWHGQRDDVTVYVISDVEHDRMRIMAPVGELRVKDASFLALLLRANFDRALDAKYALRNRELWAVFMHPLSTIVPDDLGTFVDQVVRLVKNTGTTYASSDLVFGVDDDERLDLEFESDPDEARAANAEEDDEDEADEPEDDAATAGASDDDEFDEFDEFDEDEDDESGWREGGAGFRS